MILEKRIKRVKRVLWQVAEFSPKETWQIMINAWPKLKWWQKVLMALVFLIEYLVVLIALKIGYSVIPKEKDVR